MTEPTQEVHVQKTLFEPDRDQLVSEPEAVSASEVREMTPAEKFCWFHKNNPHVYRALVEWTRTEKYEFGRSHGSMKYAFECLRRTGIELIGEEVEGKKVRKARLNNNDTAPYARLIMKNEADLVGFFRTRTRTRGDED